MTILVLTLRVVIVATISALAFVFIVTFAKPKPTTIYVLPVKLASQDLRLRREEAGENCRNPDSDILVSVTGGKIDMNKQPVEWNDLERRLKGVFLERGCMWMFIDAELEKYGDLVHIIDAGRGAGATSIIITYKMRDELGYKPR